MAVDRLSMLRAAVMFNTRVGRAPKRRDFREPDRYKWEEVLAHELPSETMVSKTFGSFGEYLNQAGLKPSTRNDYADIEQAAIGYALEMYPGMELVVAEANHFDGFLLNGEKVEVKGSHIKARKRVGMPPDYYFSFKTHYRTYHKTVDRVVCVGVGSHPQTNDLERLVVYDFPKAALSLVTNKEALFVYANSIWGTTTSQYSPYLVKRANISLYDVPHWLRPNKRGVKGKPLDPA